MFVLVVLFLCSSSCDFLESDNQIPISIKTDKNHYNLNEDDSVKVAITNRSSETIFYSTCALKEIETIKDEKIIKNFGMPICYCICPAELKPGESIPGTISSLSTEIFKSQRENLMPDKPLTYRIQYSLYYDEAFGDDPVPPEYSRSNTFKITRVE